MNDASSTSDHATNQNAPNDQATLSDGIAARDAEILQQKRRIQRNQKASFLDHLIRNIDIVIYCQLSILYYMDCSLTKFLLRALPHWLYFTPKPAIFPPTPLIHRPYIGIIFGTNILCLLLHLAFSPPAAGEATRGYLHGGLVIDFVGQRSPVGIWKLVGLDILVFALQILVLGVTLERRGTTKADEVTQAIVQLVTEPRQDHDSEERGIFRQATAAEEDIELQDLQDASSSGTGGESDRGRDELLLPDGSSEPRVHHPLDPFYTGNYIITDLHILDTIRAQWQAGGMSTGGSAGAATSGAQAAAVAAVAGRTFTYRLGQGIRRNG